MDLIAYTCWILGRNRVEGAFLWGSEPEKGGELELTSRREV
jgi:hypothetical protein